MGEGPGLRDRFRGALLGVLVGDALGMPVEGWSAEEISRELGEVREMLEARLGAGTFTDDTQMTIALAEGLLAGSDLRRPEPDLIARSFGRRFDPERGYGGTTSGILSEIRAGGEWRDVLERRQYPGGSFANGASMRVAPAALAGYPDPDAVVRVAELQARITGHEHPEGRFGARLQAVGILAGLKGGPSGRIPSPAELLRTAATGWEGSPPDAFLRRVEWLEMRAESTATDASEVRTELGTGLRAVGSVCAAMWAFRCFPDDAEEALVTAVGLGGDTDTIGAMTGALLGARLGASAFPKRWVEAVEGGREGREGLQGLADELHRRITGS